MLTKIVDRIFRLKVPMPFNMGEVNSYLLEGANGFTIVDTGDNTEEAKAVWLKTLADGLPIEKIVLTHAHPDHLGLAGWFQRKWNVPIWMSTKGYDNLLTARSFFTADQYTSPLTPFVRLHGDESEPSHDEPYYKPDTFEFEPTRLFEESEEIPLGDSIYETIWTPGHSSDHFCFYNKKEQISIVGDHILKTINPIIGSEQIGTNPLADYLHSLEKMTKYPSQYVLPGHGDLMTDISARVEEMKVHYKKRWKQTYHAIQEEGSTAFQVAECVYTGFPSWRFKTAFMQTISNLNYLESIGHVRMEERGGHIYYYQAALGKEVYDNLHDR
ncbi:MBL fold metallo-hydrolase [Sporosarcina sp. FSL K6-1522]|uniref:MBL fold metallo-hydrolase n=1 Tax=Sporosarcina sp. FSL K6-1522 TaxID=2921554 RepID=UPI003159DCD0